MGVDQLVTGGDFDDPVVDSLTSDSVNTDDLNIGGNDLLSNGDFLPLYNYGGRSSSSTGSDTYTTVLNNTVGPRFDWDTMFPSDATAGVYAMGLVDPAGDQIDVRVLNKQQNDPVAETTGISGSIKPFSIGPVEYTSPQPTGRNRFVFQARNGDGTTSVTVFAPTLAVGVKL